jgi:hypothetical protein
MSKFLAPAGALPCTAELPPVVNPTERSCISAPPSVHVRVGHTVHTSVTCC